MPPTITQLPVPRRRFFQFWLVALRPIYRAAFGMTCEGAENLPWGRGFIIASNHLSMMDWSFLSFHFPYLVRFVVHDDYYQHPLLRIGLRFNGAIPLRTARPDVTGFKLALDALAQAEPLVIFPEGGIARDGRPQRGHPGVLTLASRANVPIVPAAIRGADQVLPRANLVPRPGNVHVRFGPALPTPASTDRRTQAAQANALMDHIRELATGAEFVAPPW